ncbi:hypothetical protein PYJP_05720 [Pyrofollis japonicus]|nr:hypothetical protein PYJP_05720 [Pyrofollis japonicus]
MPMETEEYFNVTIDKRSNTIVGYYKLWRSIPRARLEIRFSAKIIGSKADFNAKIYLLGSVFGNPAMEPRIPSIKFTRYDVKEELGAYRITAEGVADIEKMLRGYGGSRNAPPQLIDKTLSVLTEEAKFKAKIVYMAHISQDAYRYKRRISLNVTGVGDAAKIHEFIQRFAEITKYGTIISRMEPLTVPLDTGLEILAPSTRTVNVVLVNEKDKLVGNSTIAEHRYIARTAKGRPFSEAAKITLEALSNALMALKSELARSGAAELIPDKVALRPASPTIVIDKQEVELPLLGSVNVELSAVSPINKHSATSASAATGAEKSSQAQNSTNTSPKPRGNGRSTGLAVAAAITVVAIVATTIVVAMRKTRLNTR